MKRVGVSRPCGFWTDWDPSLLAKCHRTSKGETLNLIDDRMSWDEPSPTITTQFYGSGIGRFKDLEQDRALKLREGAMLQSFPRDYAFVEPGKKI